MKAFLLPAILMASATVVSAQNTGDDPFLHLRYATFDPAAGTLQVPELLRSRANERLFIVQFDGLPTQARRDTLERLGVEVHGYLPENSYVVRMNSARRPVIAGMRSVRSVTPYHPAFRLEPELIGEILSGTAMPSRRYNIVVVNKRTDKVALMQSIVGLGGKIEHEQTGSILLEASLTRAQLLNAARLEQVLWIDRWTAPELDMDNARIQGGGNHIETAGGYTGKGIRGHVYEGVEATHRDFNTRAINVRSSGAAQSHGHCTAGIVFGNGNSNRAARGMAPDAQAYYTTYTSVQGSRWQVVETLVKTHQVMFTTASWGGGRTRAYTATSASTDDIIFDHDMVWTNSQSNAGNQNSRPEAWAKNIMSIGGVRHRNNANPLDDSWGRGGSTGPAADGRIKPDLCAYYDGILCSDRTGSAGYNRSGDFYTSFGGTSGATPIVAGHNALAIQMFTDGLFSPKRKANGTPWENKPHFTTLKALQIANARQYSFTSSSTDNRREHCGWGFPDLKQMYDQRKLHYVVDETDILTQGKGMAYSIRVPANQPELKVSLCFADRPANPSASLTRINDLTLRVTDPTGKRYWGNHGLKTGNYSQTGGANDVRDTVENVFIKSPAAGVWTIEVAAYLVAQDSHIETRAVDADFGLVSVGGTFVTKRSIEIPVGSFAKFGTGCPSGVNCVPCYVENWTGTSANSTTSASRIAIFESRQNTDPLCGVDFYMGSRSSTPVDVNVGIYSMNANLDVDKLLGGGQIRVSRLGNYSLKFPRAIRSDLFYIVFDQADKLELPVSRTGTPVLHREFANNQWGSAYLFNRNWQYRVQCNRGALVPSLAMSGKPLVGELVRIELSTVNPSTAAAFLLGASNSRWASLNLPFNYAASCNLLVSGEIVLGVVSDASGKASVPLQIPNDKRLVGSTAYQQFLVLDNGNSIGLISSNGGRLKVGEF